MSSFNGKDLFGSGPHRTSMARRGSLVLGELFFGVPDPASNAFGLVELELTITGRLVAGGEPALQTLRDAVIAELTDPPTRATLVDSAGRSWSDMSFVGYEEDAPADRGRERSIAYTATFRRFSDRQVAGGPPVESGG